MFVINEITLLKIVLGAIIGLPMGFSGIHSWSARTRKPKTNSAVLKISSDPTYCFQF